MSVTNMDILRYGMAALLLCLTIITFITYVKTELNKIIHKK